MIRTRSPRAAAMRVGLLTACYLFTLMAPVTAMAADPTQSMQPDVTAEVAEPTDSQEPTASQEPNSEPVQPAPPPDPSASAAPASTSPPVAAEQQVRYIVTFRAGTTADARSATLASVDGTLDTWIPELRIATVLLRGGTAAMGAASLASDTSVLRVEDDGSRDVEAAPGDPRYADQWSLPVIGWDDVRERGMPAESVVVAVLDTGVDASHPDLAGRLLPGSSFVEGQPADTDPHGHGTWLAGIVAAATDNGEGIAGIGGSGVRVMPITVLAADGSGQDSAVIAAIVAAVDGGADVILMAFSNPSYSPALQSAIDYAWLNDVVLVAANGNDGTANASYPAGDRGVMGIASTDQADRLATDSNHGPQTFMAAPGVDVLTTAADTDSDPATGDEYRSVSGTSAAAAQVAGAAAVLRAFDQTASNAVIIGRLARSAAPVGTRDETGNGRLDLARASMDLDTEPVIPAGIAGGADGGPFVGPYTVASSTTDCFRSRATGDWGATSTWESAPTSGGCTVWSLADLTPTSSASTITIRNGHTVTVAASVTVDQVVIDAGGQVTLSGGITLTLAEGSGTDLSVTGIFRSAGTVTINSGATIVYNNGGKYQHNHNANVAIPTATWSSGSTVEIIGYTSYAGGVVDLAGYGQSFWHFVWNSAGQTSNFSLSGMLRTVNGNMTVSSTGSGTVALGGSGAGDLTLGGNFAQTAGTFRGSLGAARTMTVGGSFSLSNGTFDLTSTTTAGNHVTVNVGGSFTHSSGTLTETGASTGSGIVFNGSGTQTYTSGGTVSNTVHFTVNSGATLHMASATTTLTGAGSFTLSSGATLGITSTSGITASGTAAGNIQVTGTRTYSTEANYTYNGTSAQSTGSGLPATVNNLTVNNSAGVTLTAGATVNGTLTLSSGSLSTGANTASISSTGTVTRTSGHVVGVLQKHVATGATSRTFEIGDSTNYTPVTVAFASVTTAGNLQARTTAGDHPQVGNSALTASKTANRYWTLTNSGTAFTTADATFTFASGDLDSGVNTASFVVGRYANSAWDRATMGTRTSTTTQATGLTAFGDFAVGEPLDLGIFTGHQDIGAVGIAGSSSYDSGTGTYTIAASGADVWDDVQEFRYMYRALTGDGRITARVATLQNTHQGAKAGVMFREALVTGSRHAYMSITNNGTEFIWRATSTGASSVSGTTGLAAPIWVRITRSGNTITAEHSTNGTTWTQQGTPQTISMASTIYVGLFVTSHNDAALNTSTVDNVTMATPPTAIADSYTVGENGTLSPSAPGVLSNDTDPEADALTAVLVSDASNGNLSLNANGSFSYAPDPDFSGSDSFSYKASDGTFDSNTVTVSIAVSDAPLVTDTVADLAYTENATVALDAGLTVTDADSANLASATIDMTTNYVNGQDMLAFVNANGITGTWTAATGVMALTGSASVANYQAAIRSITYTNTSDAPSALTRTFSVLVNDGDSNSNTASRNITVTAVNDAPVNTVPGAQGMLRNHRLMLSGASGTRISTSDIDAATNSVQVQLSVTNGTLSLATVAGLTFSAGDGSADATMTFSGSLTSIDKALAWVIFDPTTGFVGSASLQVATSDLGNSGSGGALTDTDSISIAVRDLGVFTGSIDVAAPTIHTASVTAPANPYGVEMNPATNRLYVPGFGSGTVAIINGTTHGTIATVPVGVGPMGLAVNQVTNRIYVPNNGTSKNGTTVSVIDGATNTVIATITAGTGPRYAAVNEATNTIYVVNNGGATVTVIDGATNTVSGTITLPSAPQGVAVNPVTNRLYVAYGGTPGRLAVYDTTTNALVTTVTVGNSPWAVGVNATTNTIYTSNFASNSMTVINGASHTVTATVTLGNWPVGLKVDPVSNRIYVAEYLADTFVSVDGTTNTVLARGSTPTSSGPIDLAVNPLTGRVYVATYGNSNVRVFQDGLTFRGTADFSSPTYTVAGSGIGMVASIDEFQFLYKTMTGDGRLTVRTTGITNTGSGATAGLMMRDTLVSVLPFVMVSSTGAGGDSVQQKSRSANFGVPATTTVTGAAVPQYLRITRVGNVFTTEYSADGSAWTQVGTPKTITMSATLYVGLAVTSENVAALNTSTFEAFTQNLAPVAAADPSYTVSEDTTLNQPAAGGVLTNDSDPESAPLTAVLVSGTSGLTLNSDGSFTYVPPADFNGVATFTYKANDGALDSNTVTATITVAAVNDAPVITPTVASLAYTENATTALDAGIVVTDVDSANLSSATVTMTANYANGQDVLAFTNQNGITGTWTAGTGVLALSGSASVANYQTALRSITYTNTSNAPSTATRTVTFVANDGSVNSATTSRTITVAAVNDAPVNAVPGTQTTVTDLAEVFSSGIGNPISISDPDAASASVQVQLIGTNGTITLSGTTGLTFSVGDGTSDATMTFTGTMTNINLRLAGMSFTPTPAFNGTATLQIVTNDQGNSGSGGALSDTDSVSIVVEPVDLGIFTAHQDIGSPGIAGTANRSSDGVYTVEGSGILGGGSVTDQLHYLYRTMAGDGQLTARVASMENTNTAAKAGVMFRDTLATDSPMTYEEIRPAAGNGAVYLWRSTTGAAAQSDVDAGIVPPYWVRMTRVGSTFRADYSVDGVTWVQQGATQTITMGATIYVGLAVVSYDNAKLATATFDNVSIDLAPTAVADSYSVDQGDTLASAAPGVLTNDTDPESGALTAALVTDVSNGSLTLNPNGSFSYTPSADFNGTDSFTYRANDAAFASNTVTVTITVVPSDGSYISSSGWLTAFDSSRYLDLTFPAYVAVGSVVDGATFRHAYRSATDGDTTCYYFEVFDGSTLLATHGSALAPVSCNSTALYSTDVVSLPEVDTAAKANNLTVRLFIRNSGGTRSAHRLATLAVSSSLD